MNPLDDPRFAAWFEGSVVVNPDGSPRVMYHGTCAPKVFKTFKIVGSDIGMHFGTSEQAEERVKFVQRRSQWDASKRDNPCRTYPVYLSIDNPVRMDDVGDFDNFDAVYEGVRGVLKRLPIERRLALENNARRLANMSRWDVRDQLEPRWVSASKRYMADLRSALASLGYDGVVYQNDYEIVPGSSRQDSYIVFSPSQIRSVFDVKPRRKPLAPKKSSRGRYASR